MSTCTLQGRRLLAVLTASLFLACSALAQSTGSIQGSVTDATGAPVPNANISIKSEATGEEHSTATDSSGNYLVPSLPVGGYRIEVKSSGMQTMVANGVDLSVGSTLKQDFTLKVASTTETVEVQAAAGVVETSSVSVGAGRQSAHRSADSSQRAPLCRPRPADSRYGHATRQWLFNSASARPGGHFPSTPPVLAKIASTS